MTLYITTDGIIYDADRPNYTEEITGTQIVDGEEYPIINHIFDREATAEEVQEAQKPKLNLKLEQAENEYVLFCRSLGLPDKASTEDFNNFVTALKLQGKELEAIEVSLKALALINEITQQGGTWTKIDYTNLEGE